VLQASVPPRRRGGPRRQRVHTARNIDDRTGAEEQPCTNRQGHRKDQDLPVEHGIRLARQLSGLKRQRRADRPPRHRKPRTGGHHREQHRFGEQLLGEPGAAGPQCRPDRQLVLASQRVREEEVGRVRARQEQQQRRTGQQDERRLTHRAGQLLAQWDERRPIEPDRLQPFGIFRIHFGLKRLPRLHPRHAVLQAGDRAPERHRGLRDPHCLEDGRRPHRRTKRIVEPRRGNPDNRQWNTVDANRRADGSGVAAVGLLPQTVADDGHAVRAGRVVPVGKAAAPRKSNAEHVEEVPRRLRQPDACGLRHAVDVHLVARVHEGVADVRTPAPPFVKRSPGTHPSRQMTAHDGKTLRLLEWQRAEKQRVQHAEHAGVGADGNRENRHRERGVERTTAPEPEGVASILADFTSDLDRQRAHEIDEGTEPQRDETAHAPDVPILVPELALERRAVLLAEAGGIELQQPAIKAFRQLHGVLPQARSRRPNRSAASATSSRSRAASACATLRPKAVSR
jgi:hypothetical protein